jgi:hypothetical protein
MACTAELSQAEAETIFQRAMQGQAGEENAARFAHHMLLENARLSGTSFFRPLFIQPGLTVIINQNDPKQLLVGPGTMAWGSAWGAIGNNWWLSAIPRVFCTGHHSRPIPTLIFRIARSHSSHRQGDGRTMTGW